MKKLFGFHGGIHPAEHKQCSNPGTLLTLPIPDQLIIPLGQHIGKPAKACIEVGQQVFKGQILAKADGHISVHVHAPSSGKIIAIESHAVAHASGFENECIILACDGLDTWHSRCQKTSSEQKLAEIIEQIAPQKIWQIIQEAGIIGMGGAGFHTAKKLANQQTINTLIINGAECEPYITADDTLMQLYAYELVAGMQLLQKLTKARTCILAIEDNKPDAIAMMSTALAKVTENDSISLVAIPTKYPSGGEKQLIENLTGKQVPSQGLPIDLGIICVNVASTKAVYDAVCLNQPSIERIITLTGDACAKPGNYHVLVGTPVEFLLAECKSQHAARVIMGGPMMGFQLHTTKVPITKTSNCLLLPDQSDIADQAMACIRCGQCEVACPVNLLPQQMYWYAKSNAFDKLEQHQLFDCIECGACAYVCPSKIPLVQHYRYAKGMMRNKAEEAKQAEYAKQRFEAREQRLADEQAAKQQKRKERAAQAAAAQAAKRQTARDGEDPVAQAQARLAAKQAATPSSGISSGSSTNRNNNQAPTPQDATEKQLKTAVAVARTKLKKTTKALDTAKSQGHENIEKLENLIKQLEKKLNDAEHHLALQLATSPSPEKPTPAKANNTEPQP